MINYIAMKTVKRDRQPTEQVPSKQDNAENDRAAICS